MRRGVQTDKYAGPDRRTPNSVHVDWTPGKAMAFIVGLMSLFSCVVLVTVWAVTAKIEGKMPSTTARTALRYAEENKVHIKSMQEVIGSSDFISRLARLEERQAANGRQLQSLSAGMKDATEQREKIIGILIQRNEKP